MTKRFTYELMVGLLGLIAIYFFAEKGLAVLALLAAHPFIGKKKADEREKQLFYKTGNLTAAITLLFCVLIYFASGISLNGFDIGANWLILAVFSFLIAHGLSGLVIFSRG